MSWQSGSKFEARDEGLFFESLIEKCEHLWSTKDQSRSLLSMLELSASIL